MKLIKSIYSRDIFFMAFIMTRERFFDS